MSNDKQNSDNSENPLIQVQTTDWNKERLAQLKQLMPDLFTNDGELNMNELKKVVDPKSVNETERYEFRWFGKRNAKREAFTPTDATLVYDEARSVNPTESENLIIEGENLAVLKLLSNSYREQVKCIYIDPPYNTGNDFVYSDKFNQDRKEYWEDNGTTENGYKIDTNAETDGRFHSNWLNMMYSRLLIARQLLKEDGVTFISIDDNEVHHLRKLCDEVFGEENFVTEFIWEKKKKPSFLHKNVGKLSEYIICYIKNSEFTFPFSIETTTEGKKYPLNNAGNSIQKLIFPPKSVQFNMEDCTIEPQEMSEGNIVTNLLTQLTIKSKINENSFSLEGEWRYSQQKIDEIIKNDEIIVISQIPFRPNHIKAGGEIKKMKNIFSPKHYNMETNEDASEQFISLFNIDLFDNPKPVKLLKTLIKSVTYTDKNNLILDFFAGSGTTGQAVTELNQEDGGNRKYILVQLPEQTDEQSEAYKAGYKKISDITIERNKRVIEKIIKTKKKVTPDLFSKKESEQEQLKGLGFKVFKLTKSNFPRVEFAPDAEKTEEENIELLKQYIKDKEAQLSSLFNRGELVTEILIKNGFKLNYTLTKQEGFKKNEMLFATDGDKETFICLDGTIENETVEYFKTHTDQKLIVLERALDTTKKWNLKHAMGDKFNAF